MIDQTASDWPEPDSLARRHSARLVDHIQHRMAAAGGALAFDKYMEEALYAPGLGYYAAGTAKFGASGDFVTAPESGVLFGKCIAEELSGIFAELPDAALIEFGAGSGALAEILMRELSAKDCAPSDYLILEPSPDLRARQQSRLEPIARQFGIRIEWLSALPASALDAVVLANEVLDAFPVTRFRVEANGIRAAGVREVAGHFCWDWSAPLQTEGPEFEIAKRFSLAPGYESETCPRVNAWMRALAPVLRRGVALIVDYGYPAGEYYLPDRVRGTLRCHYRHHAHDDPFRLVGLQDITCHVNFSEVAAAARDAGLEVLGYTSQEAYLLSLGLLDLVNFDLDDDTHDYLAKAAEAKRLLLSSEMGEAFKVMALGKNFDGALKGFGLRDRSGAL